MAKHATARKQQPEPPLPNIIMIPTEQLRSIHDQQRELRDLRKRVETLEQTIKLDSEPLIEMLENGAIAEPGCGLLVSVKADARRNVKWKEAFIDRAGELAAIRLQDQCIPTVTKSLAITLQNVVPLIIQ